MDNLVYKGFAYTRHERIFEVLIYWVDIESHSRHPGMILMMVHHHQYSYSSFEGVIFYIFPLDWCENQN